MAQTNAAAAAAAAAGLFAGPLSNPLSSWFAGGPPPPAPPTSILTSHPPPPPQPSGILHPASGSGPVQDLSLSSSSASSVDGSRSALIQSVVICMSLSVSLRYYSSHRMQNKTTCRPIAKSTDLSADVISRAHTHTHWQEYTHNHTLTIHRLL